MMDRAEMEDFDQETCLVTHRIARKRRRCGDCHGFIEPGQQVTRAAFPPNSDNPRWATYEAHTNKSLCDYGDEPGEIVPIVYGRH